MKVIVRVRSQQFQNWMVKGPERTEEILRLFKERGPRIVVPEMQRQIPLGKTGQTRESITSRETPYGFTVFSTSIIAKFLDLGTKAHLILPKAAKALRWFGVWGNPIFAKKVQHPGTAPTFFVRKTEEAVKDRIHSLLEEIWREVHGLS